MTALESMMLADEERAKNAATLDLILRAFKVFNGFTGPSSDGLWWRTDGEFAPVTLFVNDNDLFVWGCADAEELNVGNIHVLEEAYRDCAEIDRVAYEERGQDTMSRRVADHLLFCCRVNRSRPQGPTTSTCRRRRGTGSALAGISGRPDPATRSSGQATSASGPMMDIDDLRTSEQASRPA